MSANIEEIKKRYGFDDFVNLVKSAGKRVLDSGRCQCPMEGCAHKGPKAALDAQIYPEGGSFRLVCHSCGSPGARPDFIEVYQRVHGVSFSEALRQLADAPAPAPKKPNLRVLPAPVVADSRDKLSTDKVRENWSALAVSEPEAEAYLEGRRLHDAVGLGYVRFATEDSVVESFQRYAVKGWRVGLLLADVLGRPLGIQFRSIRSDVADGEKLRSLKGGHGRGVFFGRPGDIIDAHTVVVTEGVADTLAALIWTKGASGTVVVGAPGKDQVPVLAAALAEHSIELRGRTFVLLAQHDRGKRGNQSLASFTRLSQALRAAGAEVVMLNEPPGDRAKDWADAWKENELPPWPPAQLQRRREAEDDEAEETMQRAPGAAIWQDREPEAPAIFDKSKSTLQFLLSDDAYRKQILGPGNWELNEMTGEVEYGGRPMREADYTRAALGLEAFNSGFDQRRLKFPEEEIRRMAEVLAQKRPYNPVRRYLDALSWDGIVRTDEFARALGLPDSATLERQYLRRTLMAAVARAFEPGCEVHTVLVLYGPQGYFKSRFLRQLGGDWYAASSVELGSRDSVMIAQSSWLIELDELDAIMRSSSEKRVTAFLTRPADKEVQKFEKAATRYLRSSIYFGSTNEPQFLIDATGNRRYWVIDIQSPIDLAWVRANRNQLWAEAVAAYRAAGTCLTCLSDPLLRCDQHRWWLTNELEKERAAANERFRLVDPWVDLIKAHIEANPLSDFWRSEVLLQQALNLHASQMPKGTAGRLSSAMRFLGWKPGLVSVGHSGRVRAWVKVKS